MRMPSLQASGLSLAVILLCGLLSGCPGEVPKEGGGATDGSSAGGANAAGSDTSDPYANLTLHTVAEGEKPTVGYLTNGIASFWLIAEAGAKKAGEDFDANVEVRMPDGAPSQQRMIEELLATGIDGVAVTAIDAENQTSFFNDVAEQTNLITQDSDAPQSNRICYIGMSNYVAGRLCGKLVKEALPDGGSLMVFVGRLEQDNAHGRRQGLIDELMDRSDDPTRNDPNNQVIKNDKYAILDTRTDGFDFGAAKAQAEDALTAHPDLDAMVGLFAYNPPILIEALKGADKLGKVQVIGFDEDDRTLQAIVDGNCYGTIVQNPYRYGYESVRILAGLARGDKSVLPEGGFLDFPARRITKLNVDEFWSELKSLVGENRK